MTQSMITPAAPFTASKKATRGSRLAGSRTEAAAAKRRVAKMRGRRSMSAAAPTGFRGMISRSRSLRDTVSTTAAEASAVAWYSAAIRSRTSGSREAPGFTSTPR